MLEQLKTILCFPPRRVLPSKKCLGREEAESHSQRVSHRHHVLLWCWRFKPRQRYLIQSNHFKFMLHHVWPRSVAIFQTWLWKLAEITTGQKVSNIHIHQTMSNIDSNQRFSGSDDSNASAIPEIVNEVTGTECVKNETYASSSGFVSNCTSWAS